MHIQFGEILSILILSRNKVLAYIKGHNSSYKSAKMTGNNTNVDLVNIQNLVKFYHFVLKISSKNKIMKDRMTDGWNDGQPKSIIAPLFQSASLAVLFKVGYKK